MEITARKSKETARDYAFRTLRKNIVNLKLQPGSMVSEKELADEMGISRTPTREALIELSKSQIVDILPQKGSYISKIDYSLVDEARFMRLVLENGRRQSSTSKYHHAGDLSQVQLIPSVFPAG